MIETRNFPMKSRRSTEQWDTREQVFSSLNAVLEGEGLSARCQSARRRSPGRLATRLLLKLGAALGDDS